jgi:hypothetical protein
LCLKPPVHGEQLCSKNPNSVRLGFVDNKSYQWWGSFITVWRSSKWYEGLAIRYMGKQSRNCCAVQCLLSTAPYAPPIVLQTFSCWIEKSPFGCGIDCYSSVNSIPTRGFADVPFQNLAISARSNGSWLILSINPLT